MKFEDRQVPIALVTGAARRIGAAIVTLLHQNGYNVLIHYHQSEQAARSLASQLNTLRPNSAELWSADLASLSMEAIQALVACLPRLDLLVNNASVFLPSSWEAQPMAVWDYQFQLNVKVPMMLSLASRTALAKTAGSIINIGDIHAKAPLKGYSCYVQTKAALLMQTQSLAYEWGPEVRVNAILPGAIAWPEGDNTLDEMAKAAIVQSSALKRQGEPADIAQAVLALVQNRFITGALLPVDGGRHLSRSIG